jgi:hypothetical protein
VCKEGHEEILEQLSNFEARLRSIESMQQHINKRVMDEDYIQGMKAAREIRELVSSGRIDLMKNGLSEMQETVENLNMLVFGNPQLGELGLAIIINGSEELGVEPLRKTLSRVAITHDRFVWLAGILGVTSITGLIGWVLFLLNRGGLP